MSEHFYGDQKKLDHFLLAYEKKIIKTCLPRVPSWLGTVALTLMTVLWSIGVMFFGYLANTNIHWLWAFSAFIFFEHVTDMLDGAVGRARNEGLIKWGFYMDHFLDYAFLCAIIIGYSFLLPSDYSFFVLATLALSGGFMVHTFLDFAVTNEFKISYNRFGISEMRYAMILLNTALIFFGKEFFVRIFPYVPLIYLAVLVFLINKSQKTYRLLDSQHLHEDSAHETTCTVGYNRKDQARASSR